MSAEEREEQAKEAKAKATIMLLQVQEYLEAKDHAKAKEMFVRIGECLLEIQNPDSQALQLLELSCSYLANSYKSSVMGAQARYEKREVENRRSENLLVLKYNKFSGEFELEDFEGAEVNRDVIQYMSKINAILFGYQSVQGDHSLLVILKTYWLAFLITAILMTLTLVFLISDRVLSFARVGIEILTIILGGCLIIPLSMIYLKQPEQRNTSFFEQKLGEEIHRINQDCKSRGKPLTFMMPHGGEINVRLDEPQLVPVSSSCPDPHTIDNMLMKEIKGLTKVISMNSNSAEHQEQ